MKGGVTCEREGCDADGIDCFLLDDPPGRPSHRFCPGHAPDEGFCAGCGRFIAGSGDADFERAGLCETCYSDVAGDEDDVDDEESDYDAEGVWP